MLQGGRRPKVLLQIVVSILGSSLYSVQSPLYRVVCSVINDNIELLFFAHNMPAKPCAVFQGKYILFFEVFAL